MSLLVWLDFYETMKSFCLFIALIGLTGALNPLSDEFIERVNSKASTWTARRTFNPDMTQDQIRRLVGARKSVWKLNEIVKKKKKVEIPESFDAREQWPQCKSLREIRDQGACSADWALAAVSAMSDRLCIASNGTIQVSLSPLDLISCCDYCEGGCGGAGYTVVAWWYWQREGLVSGSPFNSTEGCQSYPFAPCDHFIEGNYTSCGENEATPECSRQCDVGSSVDFNSSLTFGEFPYAFVKMEDIQEEIMTNGPVNADFSVFEDFLTCSGGVYQKTDGHYVGRHSVKLLGWGVEKGVLYWLAANSWNEDWGEQGYFRILRGEHHLGIEDDVLAGAAIVE